MSELDMPEATPQYQIAIAKTLNRHLQLSEVTPADVQARAIGPIPGKPGFSIRMLPIHWSILGGQLIAIYRVALSLNADDAEDSEFGRIRVALRVSYIMHEFPEDGRVAVPHFLAMTGWMHAWPYFRSEIQQLSTKLGFPPLLLPILQYGETGDTIVKEIPSDE